MVLEYLPVIVTVVGIITSLSMFLQTIKIMHLHESRDVALPFYLLIVLNSLLWVTYGFTIGDFPLIITFSIAIMASISVVIVYFVYRKKGKFEKMKK